MDRIPRRRGVHPSHSSLRPSCPQDTAWASGPPAKARSGAGPSGETGGELANRRELLIGHLLRAANVPLQAFPALVEHLQRQNLLSQWVSWSLVHKPSIFEFAFNRAFSGERKREWSP